mmetsp:Transcript_26014/g.70408  ORF Transcript_26014/g.70408 Transcript_26014/m.70408 type:complete len:367 (-) Transcript_26014:163-1263(-)
MPAARAPRGGPVIILHPHQPAARTCKQRARTTTPKRRGTSSSVEPRASVLHANAVVPAVSDTSTAPHTLAEGIGAMHIHHGWQAIWGVEVFHRLDRCAMKHAQALLEVAFVGLGRSTVRNGEVVDEDNVSLLILVGCGEGLDTLRPLLALGSRAVWRVVGQAGVEEVVVLVEELAHLLVLEQAQALLVWLVGNIIHLDHRARHAQVEVNRQAARDGVRVHHGVEYARVGVYGHVPLPPFRHVIGEHVERGALVRIESATPILRYVDDVVAHVGEHATLKGAVVVPLRPDAEDSHIRVVGQTEDVAIGGARVHTVRRVHLAPPPVLGCADLLLAREYALVLEHDEAALGHFPLQCIKYVLSGLLAQV